MLRGMECKEAGWAEGGKGGNDGLLVFFVFGV